MITSLAREIVRARARGIPLIAVRTADQPAARRAIIDGLQEQSGEGDTPPILALDPVSGISGANSAGRAVLPQILGDLDPSMATDPVTALQLVAQAPESTAVIYVAGDRALSEPRPAVAALLLRDVYAATGRTLIVLGAGWTPAAELGSDVHTIDDSLPESSERRSSVVRLLADATIVADEPTIDQSVAYTRGLSAFVLEQTVSLALSKRGLDTVTLARVWREAIERIQGLRVECTGKEASFDSIAGLASLKAHAMRLVNGRARPDSFVWVDELEKTLAGSSGAVADSSGASQVVLQGLLTAMDGASGQPCEGLILVGPGGTGKSLSARTFGAAASVPVIALNPARLKGGIVGETERNTEAAMRSIRSLGGRTYWIATCNGVSSLPPELLRRFTDGIWMVDLPDRVERAALWALYLAKYELSDPAPANDAGYTGSDVRNVCRTAWRDRVPLAEVVAEYVPSSRAAADKLEALRRTAVGCYRSASYPGAYRYPEPEAPIVTGGRKLALKGAD